MRHPAPAHGPQSRYHMQNDLGSASTKSACRADLRRSAVYLVGSLNLVERKQSDCTKDIVARDQSPNLIGRRCASRASFLVGRCPEDWGHWTKFTGQSRARESSTSGALRHKRDKKTEAPPLPSAGRFVYSTEVARPAVAFSQARALVHPRHLC